MVQYPGLPRHEQHHIMEKLRNKEYGYGGILTLDLGSQKVPLPLSASFESAAAMPGLW